MRFITGATGVGTGAHLHFGVLDEETGEYEDSHPYAGFLKVGGKALTEQFEKTSGFGHRHAPTAGASSFHRGTDYGTPEGTEVSFDGAQYLRTWEDPNGGGVVNEYRFKDPKTGRSKIAKFLHGSTANLERAQQYKASGGKAGSPAGTPGNFNPGAPLQALPAPDTAAADQEGEAWLSGLQKQLSGSGISSDLMSKLTSQVLGGGGSEAIAPSPEDRGALNGVQMPVPKSAAQELFESHAAKGMALMNRRSGAVV